MQTGLELALKAGPVERGPAAVEDFACWGYIEDMSWRSLLEAEEAPVVEPDAAAETEAELFTVCGVWLRN